MARRLRVRIRVRGRVQGVGFRWFAAEDARRLGLSGWIRNLASGEVEAEAEGPEQAVRDFLSALRHGPPGARVDGIEREDLEPMAGQAGFVIRRD